MSILLVDADNFLQTICADAFAREGFDAVRATRATEAIELARQLKPEAIVTDLLLAEGDGFDVLEALLEYPVTNAVSIFIYAASGAKEDMDRCLALGAKQYFIKSQHAPEAIVRAMKVYGRG